jgi:hypothetical protein
VVRAGKSYWSIVGCKAFTEDSAGFVNLFITLPAETACSFGFFLISSACASVTSIKRLLFSSAHSVKFSPYDKLDFAVFIKLYKVFHGLTPHK